MADRTGYYLTIAVSGFIGAGLTAVGNAFGFSRRIKDVEDSVKCFNKRKEDYYTKTEQNGNRDATKELIAIRFEHHSEMIEALTVVQKEGFDGVHQRLDDLIKASVND